MTPDRPRVSVVIPTYNTGHMIREAVASVFAAATGPLDIILVDDASTDDTPATLREAFGEEARVRMRFLRTNVGPGAARNAGLDLAEGPWVAFLDGDDAWLPDRLAVQLAAAAAEPDVALFCGATIPLEEGEKRPTSNARRETLNREVLNAGVERPRRQVVGRRIELDEFVTGNPVATSTVLVKKAVLDSVGGFDEQFRGPEDYDLWMRLVSKHMAMYLDRPLSRYRYVPGSLSMDDRTFLPQVLRVLDKAFTEGGALSDREEVRDAAISNQLWNASWMAFNRGARGMALKYLAKAFVLNRNCAQPVSRPWSQLFIRYIGGRRLV